MSDEAYPDFSMVYFRISPLFVTIAHEKERWGDLGISGITLDYSQSATPQTNVLFCSSSEANRFRQCMNGMVSDMGLPPMNVSEWVYHEMPMKEQIFFVTTAEESYDYGYCKTICNVDIDFGGETKKGRLVGAWDRMRVNNYQLPRNSSGNHFTRIVPPGPARELWNSETRTYRVL